MLDKKVIEINKPIYIGFAVLDIFKTLMYDYNYNVIKKHYKVNKNFMCTDTNSLVYCIKRDNFYVDLLINSSSTIMLSRMDIANLSRSYSYYITERK